jgi:hypothetical protein
MGRLAAPEALGRAAASAQAEVWARKFRRFIEAFLQKMMARGCLVHANLNERWGRLFFEGILRNAKEKRGEVVVNSWWICGESWRFAWHDFEVKHKTDF